MFKKTLVLAIVVVTLAGAAAFAAKKAVVPEGPSFSAVALEATDGQIQELENLCGGRLDRLMPRWTKLFSPGNQVYVVRISRKLAVPLQANAVDPADRGVRTRWAVRLFDVPLTEQITTDKKGTRVQRPYRAVLTKGGSVIRGAQVFGLAPEEIDVALVVSSVEGGRKLTFIKLF